jgi:CheY-like chemotaxis protein
MSKILAVDNDPFILSFLKDVLTSEGHKVLTAKDGLHAVDVLDEHTPDIIFVDLVMPNIDGKRLCKIIRAMGKLENVYFVVLSGTTAVFPVLLTVSHFRSEHFQKLVPLPTMMNHPDLHLFRPNI